MTKAGVAKRIIDCGLIPIVRFERLEQAMGVVSALHDAGVDIVEFPLTSPHALKAIEKAADAFGGSMVVGAGTVLEASSARSCIHAGARFIVSPCINIAVINACRRASTIVCPGALTPTEAYTGWKAGADFIKIFPCGSMGGVSYIQSLRVPLPRIPFIPVGGVTVDNIGNFIRAGCPAVGIGAGIVDSDAMENGRYGLITKKASLFAKALRSARTQAANRP